MARQPPLPPGSAYFFRFTFSVTVTLGWRFAVEALTNRPVMADRLLVPDRLPLDLRATRFHLPPQAWIPGKGKPRSPAATGLRRIETNRART